MAKTEHVVTPNDDLATAIETLGASDGLVQLSKGVHFLKRKPTIPRGTVIAGVGGFADSGVGTEIRQRFDDYSMLRWTSSGGIRDLSLTVTPGRTPAALLYLDGSTPAARPTWFQISNVVIPKYTGFGVCETGLLADGSAWTTPGSQGVRDLTINGFYVYGATDFAINFRHVVNVSITGGSCGSGGQGRAKISLTDCDSIHVGAHTLWGDLTIERCRNVSWIGGRVDKWSVKDSVDVQIEPCNKVK